MMCLMHLFIGLVDIRVANCAIFVVADGSKAWLVDTLQPTTSVQKFSGTNQAGANNKLPGQTCDALAHYSLDSTNGSLVLVDIQGTLL